MRALLLTLFLISCGGSNEQTNGKENVQSAPQELEKADRGDQTDTDAILGPATETCKLTDLTGNCRVSPTSMGAIHA